MTEPFKPRVIDNIDSSLPPRRTWETGAAWNIGKPPPSTTPLRAFIYARRSSDPNGVARAISDQTYEGQQTCERYGWIVAGEFADPDNSASRHARKKRPDYDDMVKRAEAGECDVIVSWESVRLSRDIAVFTQLANLCERTRVLLCLNGTVFDMSNSDQRFFAQFTVLQGGFEADKTRDRVLRTTDGLAREGRPTGMTPFGYRREYDPESGRLLRQVPDEATAPIVAELTKRVAAGETLLTLAREMQARGVPTPKAAGGKWLPTMVRQIVMRETNIAKRVHRGRVVRDATWAPIVAEADFYAAVKVLTDPARRSQKNTAATHLLSGIAYCPQGHKLYTISRGGRDRRNGSRRYSCPTCFSVTITVDVFEDLVTAAVLAYVERPEFTAALTSAGLDDERRQALALAVELEAELEQARGLAGKVVNGRLALSVTDFAVISAQLTEQIEAARAQAQEVTVPTVLQRFAGPGARAVWAASNLQERRALIREVVRVTLNPAGPGARTVRPDRVTWDWQW